MALWCEQAWLAEGWAENVRLTIVDGHIGAIEVAAPPQPGDDRHAILIPGLPDLHSHAFQRGMAGLACGQPLLRGSDLPRYVRFLTVGRLAAAQAAGNLVQAAA